MVYAMCILHNIIMDQEVDSSMIDSYTFDVRCQRSRTSQPARRRTAHSSVVGDREMKKFRDDIANRMWNDYINYQ